MCPFYLISSTLRIPPTAVAARDSGTPREAGHPRTGATEIGRSARPSKADTLRNNVQLRISCTSENLFPAILQFPQASRIAIRDAHYLLQLSNNKKRLHTNRRHETIETWMAVEN